MSYPTLHSWSRTGVTGTCGVALQLWAVEAAESCTEHHALYPCVGLQLPNLPDLPFSTSVTKSFLPLPTWCASHSSRSNSRVLCFMKPCRQVCVPPRFLCWNPSSWEGGIFDRRLGHESRALTCEVSTSIRRDASKLSFSSPPSEETIKKPLTRTQSTGALTSQPAEPKKYQFLLFWVMQSIFVIAACTN